MVPVDDVEHPGSHAHAATGRSGPYVPALLGTVHPKEIARELDFSTSAGTGALDRLEDDRDRPLTAP
jgi:DNA-binding MarR family transcriptional regulator